MSICLSMICGNEAAVIGRCLRSVREHISHWAIVHNSTDDTRSIIERELAGIPGRLVDRKWTGDYAAARNAALDLARESGADYAMFLDADEELVGDLHPGALLSLPTTIDVFEVMRDVLAVGTRAWTPTLVRLSLPFRWIYPLHEDLACDSPEPLVMARIPEHNLLRRNYTVHDPAEVQRRIAQLILMARAEPRSTHHLFYLAQELRLADQVDDAIVAYRACIGIAPIGDPFGELAAERIRQGTAA